jgi:hypothetical protein
MNGFPAAAPPRRDGAFAVAVAVGAAGAALAGGHAVAEGAPALPDAAAITADLHLSAIAHHTGAGVAPVAAPAVSPTSAEATVPELTKAAKLQAHRATVEAAIDRFESRIGTTRYENYCERAVENAFGTQGHYGSAIADWHARDQHPDWQHAPRGALVFYDTSPNGHVALSLGDGRVVSSSAHHQVGIVPVGYFQHPLGWAPAPY